MSDYTQSKRDFAYAAEQAKRGSCTRALKALLEGENHLGRAVNANAAPGFPKDSARSVILFRRYCMTPKARVMSRGQWWSGPSRRQMFSGLAGKKKKKKGTR